MSGTYGGQRGYRFGEFTLDVDRGSLSLSDSQVPLRPKSFDVLQYLVERQGQVVGRDELLDNVWAGTVVTDESVTQCLIDIRKALGDKSQEIVRTVHRRGYIFELPVEELPQSGQTSDTERTAMATRTRNRLALAVPLAAIAVFVAWYLSASPFGEQEAISPPVRSTGGPSIAILPFDSMNPDQAQTYFADGVSEEIISSLARQPGMKVIARTSSFAFRDKNADVAEIASKLDVSHVLEGSVRNDADSVRVNVQLVDAGSGEYVWTEQYERELSATTVFDIQTEIATAVVRSLQTELSPEERARLIRVPTENMAALNHYFEARQLMETRRAQELDHAIVLLRLAIEQDPDFALAYVALADTLRLASNYGSLSPIEADDRGMQAVRTALAIDDRLGEAYASLGNLQLRSGNIGQAEESFKKGIELSPSYAPAYQWYGQLLSEYGGRPREAVNYLRIAAALDPRSAIINADYADSLAAAGRLQEAVSQFETVMKIDPVFAKAYFGKGMVLKRGLGNIADAIPYFKTAAKLSPDDPGILIYLAEAYLDLGDQEAATSYVEESLRLSPLNPHAHLGNLRVSAVLGDSLAATRSAELVAVQWSGYAVALRYLRDKDINSGNIASAIDRYQHYYPEFAHPDGVNITGWNFDSAIDYAYLLMVVDRHEDAEHILADSLQFVLAHPKALFRAQYRIAEIQIHAIRGETDKAFLALKNAIDDGWRTNWRFTLEHDLALAELRRHPDFDVMVDIIRNDMERQRETLTENGLVLSGTE